MSTYTDAQLGLLASIVVVNGWYVDEGNFADMALFHRRGLITVHDAEEGHVRANATEKGIRLALRLKLAVRNPPEDRHWSDYGFGPNAPKKAA